MSAFLKHLLAGLTCVGIAASGVSAEDAATVSEDSAERLAQQGAYIARAADCMSCHAGPDGTPYAGGRSIETPIGAIVAPNITPSYQYGIGTYSEADFRAVLKEGKSPDHMLYPAMPYPYYRGMSEDDISALWAYMQSVEPIDRAPEAETDLPFPFNIRTSMRVWNVLALEDEAALPSDSADPVARGRYLVETLGHCGACHTPRNGMMMTRDDRHLGGAEIQGWDAPNITPSQIAGLGRWEVADIVDYLRTGQAMDVVQAAGPMAEVVHYSTRHMTDADLSAIAHYLKSLPVLETEGQEQPVILPPEDRPAYTHRYGEIREDMRAALSNATLSGTEALYIDHCASCHGVKGEGQSSAYYPPLLHSATARRADATNLTQVIANGVQYAMLYRAPPMPGFRDDLDDAQIAELANYVRTEFGGFENSDLTAGDVDAILNPEADLAFYIEHAGTLAWIGIVVGLMIAVAVIWLLWRRFGRPRTASQG